MSGQETNQTPVSLKSKLQRLEAIESKLKKRIEALKSAHAEFSYKAHKTKGPEHWIAKGSSDSVSIIIKELEKILE